MNNLLTIILAIVCICLSKIICDLICFIVEKFENRNIRENNFLGGYSYCLDCKKQMEIETDIQLCQKCMNNYNINKLWELHDKNKLDALDFNESNLFREQFRK